MGNIVLETPDLSKRGMTREFKRATDHAFAQHREKYMPLHFKRVAFMRYGDAYDSDNREGGARKRKVKISRSDRTEYNRARRQRRRDTKDWGKKKKKKLPLVVTGRLRLTTIRGSKQFIGPATNRRMRFTSVPAYIFINPPGRLNKLKALTAIVSPEEKAFAKSVDTDLQLYFSKSTKRRQQ